jgi:DNA-binding CsgD family transcriptional regulator
VRGIPHSASVERMFEYYVRDGWYLRDERTPCLAMFARMPVVLEQDFTTREAMAKSPYYQEFLRSSGVKWFAGIGFRVGGDWWAAAIQRSERQGPFDEADRERLSRLSGHLSRSANLSVALHDARTEGALDAFQQMAIGAVAIDERGSAILVNKAAQELMGDGLQITGGRLRATNAGAATRLESLVRASAGLMQHGERQIPDAISVPRPSGKRAYQISLCPLGQRSIDIFCRARIIILIVDPEQKRKPRIDRLRAQFGLTLTEAKLAEHLARGGSVAEAAQMLSITEGTARFYLKSLLSKTDTHRQGQLIALLNSLTPLL